jgi:Flp pilus assembly pilin Flp
MMFRTRPQQKKRKGAALVEYAVLVGGVTLMALASVAILGHKTTDMIAAVAAVLPGAHTDDNGPIQSGKLIETTDGGTGPIEVDTATILTNSGTNRLGNNVGVGLDTLVTEP